MMNKKVIFVSAMVIFLLGLVQTSFGRQASFRGLSDLPGGNFESHAVSVSDDGSNVVGDSLSGSGREAFIWTEATGIVSLGDLPGANVECVAYGVSANGSVVVGFGSSNLAQREAFRWEDLNGNGRIDPNERLDNHPEFGLGDLPGGEFYSEALGVSADGLVVVGGGNSASGQEAFRWTSASSMVGLGDLPGGAFTVTRLMFRQMGR